MSRTPHRNEYRRLFVELCYEVFSYGEHLPGDMRALLNTMVRLLPRRMQAQARELANRLCTLCGSADAHEQSERALQLIRFARTTAP